MYFGEQETESPPVQDMEDSASDTTHDEVGREPKAAVARQLPIPPDDGRPALLFRQNNDDEDPPSGLSFQAPAESTAVTLRSLGGSRTGDSLPSKPADDAGSQSDVSISFSGLSDCTFLSSVPLSPPFVQSDDFSMGSDISPRSSQRAIRVPSLSPVFLTRRVFRRIMAAKESIFKYGTFVPKNDREAESSPEASRWKAGRTLEWLRLEQHGTFDGDWTWDKVCKAYPSYKKSDVGFFF